MVKVLIFSVETHIQVKHNVWKNSFSIYCATEYRQYLGLLIFVSRVVACINRRLTGYLFLLYSTCGERGNTEDVICACAPDVNVVNNNGGSHGARKENSFKLLCNLQVNCIFVSTG